MWEAADERIALLELLTRGTLKRRRAQARALDALAELSWTRKTGRRDELGLVEEHRPSLVALIDRAWPDWPLALSELAARGLPPTPDGWARLLDARRAESLGEQALPERINRRTAASLVAPHSKATLTAARLSALGGARPTHDGSVRLRPPAGLLARSEGREIDLSRVAGVLGEVSIPERALLDGLELAGPLRAALSIENLGAWRDLPPLDGWLYAHVPGWDTSTVTLLLDRLAYVPVVHFGDLDPNGVRIAAHLRERRADLVWLVPSFWREHVEAHASRARWPDDLPLDDAPPLVRELAERGLWLEQERVVLDPRLLEALEASVA